MREEEDRDARLARARGQRQSARFSPPASFSSTAMAASWKQYRLARLPGSARERLGPGDSGWPGLLAGCEAWQAPETGPAGEAGRESRRSVELDEQMSVGREYELALSRRQTA
jgi:hypothetical protein